MYYKAGIKLGKKEILIRFLLILRFYLRYPQVYIYIYILYLVRKDSI